MATKMTAAIARLEAGRPSGPFEHIVEERQDASRLLLRCSELDGGCGAVCECSRARNGRGQQTWVGYIQFWRDHANCGKETRHGD